MAKKGTSKGEKEKTKKNPFARLIVIAAVLAIICAAVIIVLNVRPVAGQYVTDEEFKTPDYLRSKVMNLLICGVDMDPLDGSRYNYMTDVIIVAQIDLEANKATLLQIPRDTYIGYGTTYTGKINALYNWGYATTAKREAEEPAGIEYLIEVINEQFKLPIDGYVTITMEGFRKAVDTLGGVEVSIDQNMHFETKDEAGNITGSYDLEPGTHLLSGEMADLFVRYREYTNADIDRLNVQRYFMAALMNRLLSTPTMDLVKLVMSVYDYLETDLTVNELIQLASEAKGLSSESIVTVRVPGEGVRDYVYNGTTLRNQWIFTVHKKALADMLNEYMRPYSDDVPETELEVIEVQNTTDVLDDTGSSLQDYS